MRRSFLVGAAFALLSSDAAMAGGFDAGAAAFQRGDHDAALTYWSALAAEGHQDAQFNLGIMYDQGIGVGQRPADAIRWFEEAAQQGDAIAAFNLGLIYADGRGVPQDYSQAARWLGFAADRQHPEAMEKLSFLYANGRGVEQDLRRAVRLTEDAQEAECLAGAPGLNRAVRLTAMAAPADG